MQSSRSPLGTVQIVQENSNFSLCQIGGSLRENMTIEELVAEYNRHGTAEPLERRDRGRDELVEMVRVARKQSTPDGIIAGISVSDERRR